MLTREQKDRWAREGFFIEKAMFEPDQMETLNSQLVERLRSDPPEANRDDKGELGSYASGPLLVALEKKGMSQAARPEDHVSKVFSAHKEEGLAQDLMRDRRILGLVSHILDGSDVAIVQSQFIFKNPSAWGQPWHQDSYYFKFSNQPQVGVWIATSPARIENGCLFVAPGSHTEDIQTHHPEARENSNYAYMEILDYDFSSEIPVLLNPGDVLFFHSYLMHKSVDNVSDERRTALVYHYAKAGTKNLNPRGSMVVDIQPVSPL